MYSIEKKDFGYKLVLGGFIQNDEMEKWRLESQSKLAAQRGPFGVWVDMRDLKPLPPDSKETMVKGQQLYKQAGMARSVVILNDAITAMQFKRLAKESGIYAWERYISAGSTPDWEQIARTWLVDGVDPDQSSAAA